MIHLRKITEENFIPVSNAPSAALARAFGECREGQYPAACGGVIDYSIRRRYAGKIGRRIR